jgi:hypothetical protein
MNMIDKNELTPIVLVAYLKDVGGPRFLAHVPREKQYYILVPGEYNFDAIAADTDDTAIQIVAKYGYLPFIKNSPVFASRTSLEKWIAEQAAANWPNLG